MLAVALALDLAVAAPRVAAAPACRAALARAQRQFDAQRRQPTTGRYAVTLARDDGADQPWQYSVSSHSDGDPPQLEFRQWRRAHGWRGTIDVASDDPTRIVDAYMTAFEEALDLCLDGARR